MGSYDGKNRLLKGITGRFKVLVMVKGVA